MSEELKQTEFRLRTSAARLARLLERNAPPVILEREIGLITRRIAKWREASGHDHAKMAEDRRAIENAVGAMTQDDFDRMESGHFSDAELQSLLGFVRGKD